MHTLDIDTVLDIMGHDIGAHSRDILQPTIRTGHWHEKVDPEEGGASDTYYIQVFREPAGAKLELEVFVGRDARSRFDFSGIDQYPNYEWWLSELYTDLSSSEG